MPVWICISLSRYMVGVSQISRIREKYLSRMRYGDIAVATIKFAFLSGHEKTAWDIWRPLCYLYSLNKELIAELQVLLSFCIVDFSTHSSIIIFIGNILFYSVLKMNLFQENLLSTFSLSDITLKFHRIIMFYFAVVGL